MVSFRLRPYSRIGHIPVACIASYSGGDYQTSFPTCWAVLPMILLEIRWQNESNTFLIASVIT